MRPLILLFAALTLLGQDEGLVTLKREVTAAHASQVGPRAPGIWRESVKTIHEDLRLWLESRLPKDVYSLAAESARAQDSMRRALAAVGLTEADSAQTDLSYGDPGFSYIRIELKLFPELSDVVFVTAGVSLPCGTDEAVYAYRFDAKGRRLIVDNHATGEQEQGDGVIELSDPDSQGRRLLLIRRNGIQCGSSWMRMFYTVYRLGSAAPPELLLSSEHTFWLDDELFVLKADELLMEFKDTSLDTERRTMLFRYSFAQGAKRLEPVALQPQDFAEEWLTRPWSEMKSMSAPDTQAWHDKFHADFMLGKYSRVAPCSGKAWRLVHWNWDKQRRQQRALNANGHVSAGSRSWWLSILHGGGWRRGLKGMSGCSKVSSKRIQSLALRRAIKGASLLT